MKENRCSPVWVLLPLVLLAALAASATEAAPLPAKPASLLDRFRTGPMAQVQEIIFAARKMNETDGHWYANLGYYAHDPNRKAWRGRQAVPLEPGDR